MISKDKTYRTRDGREVRIYALPDVGDCIHVHGAIKKDIGWDVCSWRWDGRRLQCEMHKDDLIEVKPRIKRTVWLNVYEDDITGPFSSLYEAKLKMWERPRLACVKVEIDCEHGEGL